MYDRELAPSEEKTNKFKYLSPMLDSALSEMREFSKKKQDGIVSETKIKILNRLLTDLRMVLENEESISYLDPLDEAKLPQNSDAVLILGQYRAAMNSFEKKHYRYVGSTKMWITKEYIESADDEGEEEDWDEDE